ncbi:MAG: type II 3-dehydroquinate dehydratase [Actinomycetes bacterium]
MKSILIISGPNLNLLGDREPEVYGSETLDDHIARATRAAKALHFSVTHVQSNHEGEIIDAIHAARARASAVLINAGAFTHTSWAIHDALKTFEGPVVEVHLSNPAAREPFRHLSVIAPAADGAIAGFGGLGYELAVEAIAKLIGD